MKRAALGSLGFVKEKPVTFAVGAVIGGAGVLVGVPLAVSAVGFTAAGPAAGSFAAAKMSAIAVAGNGGVQAGSWYAMMQSAAMTGGLVGAKAAVGGAVVGGTTAAAVRS